MSGRRKIMAPGDSTNNRDTRERAGMSAPWAKPLSWVKTEILNIKKEQKGYGEMKEQIQLLFSELNKLQTPPEPPPSPLSTQLIENVELRINNNHNAIQKIRQEKQDGVSLLSESVEQITSRVSGLEERQSVAESASKATLQQALREMKEEMEALKKRQAELQEDLDRLQGERWSSVDSVRTGSGPIPVTEHHEARGEDSLIDLGPGDGVAGTGEGGVPGLDDPVPENFNNFEHLCITPTAAIGPSRLHHRELIDFSDEFEVAMARSNVGRSFLEAPGQDIPSANFFEWTREFDTIEAENIQDAIATVERTPHTTVSIATVERTPHTTVTSTSIQTHNDSTPQHRSNINVPTVSTGNQTVHVQTLTASAQTDVTGLTASAQTDVSGLTASAQTDVSGLRADWTSITTQTEWTGPLSFKGEVTPESLAEDSPPLSVRSKASLEKHKSAIIKLTDGHWLAAILFGMGYLKLDELKLIINLEGNGAKIEKTLSLLEEKGEVGFEGLVAALCEIQQQGLAALLSKGKDAPTTTMKFRLDFAPKQGKAFTPASIHKLTAAEQHMNSHWSSLSWQRALTDAISRCGYPVQKLTKEEQKINVAIYSAQAVDSLLQETRSTGSSNLSQAIAQVVLTEDVREIVDGLDLVVKCSTSMDTQTSLKMRALLTMQRELNINSSGRDDSISRSRKQDGSSSPTLAVQSDSSMTSSSTRSTLDQRGAATYALAGIFPKWSEMKNANIRLNATNDYLEKEVADLRMKIHKLQEETIKDLEDNNEKLQDDIDQERETKMEEIEKVRNEFEEELKTKDQELTELNEKYEQLKQAKEMELEQVLEDLREKEAELSKLQKEYQESAVQATSTISYYRSLYQRCAPMLMSPVTTVMGGARGGRGRGNMVFIQSRGRGRGSVMRSPNLRQSPSNNGAGALSENLAADGDTAVTINTSQRSVQFNNEVDNFLSPVNDSMYNDNLENDVQYEDDTYVQTYAAPPSYGRMGNTTYYNAKEPYDLATVLCLDVSGSMAGDAFQQVKGVVRSLLNHVDSFAYEKGYQERLALVAFGKETALKVPLTYNTEQLEKCLDSLSPCGMSPLGPAFEAATKELEKKNTSVNLYGLRIPARIIIFTDGNMSMAHSDGGDSDVDVTQPQNEPLYQFMDSLQTYASSSDKDVSNLKAKIIFVGCGTKNKDILTSVAKTANGDYLDIDDEDAMDSISLYYRRLVKICDFSASFHNMTGKCHLKASEEVFTATILTNGGKQRRRDQGDNQLEKMELKTMYKLYSQLHEEGYLLCSHSRGTRDTSEVQGRLPLGTRVRRGADYNYGNEDSQGVGTVVGYDEKGYVTVNWDGNNCYVKYRYGHGGCYDVLAVDEPRKLAAGDLIRIGVRVQRGPDWRYQDIDGGTGSKGVVYNLAENGFVRIRWDNSNLLDCRFGFEGFFDVAVCQSQ